MINKNLLINGSLDRWIFVIVVLVIGTYELIRLKIEFNPKNFYAQDLMEVQGDEEYQQKFRCIGNDNLVLAVIYSKGGIFRRKFLQKYRRSHKPFNRYRRCRRSLFNYTFKILQILQWQS